jgi:hypothetical protein
VPHTVASEIIRARATGRRNLTVEPVRSARCALLLEQAALLESLAADLRRTEIQLACARDRTSARRELHRARLAADAARRALDRLGRAFADQLASEEALTR